MVSKMLEPLKSDYGYMLRYSLNRKYFKFTGTPYGDLIQAVSIFNHLLNYENTPIQIYTKFYLRKLKMFR